jgi:hypothetical protein
MSSAAFFAGYRSRIQGELGLADDDLRGPAPARPPRADAALPRASSSRCTWQGGGGERRCPGRPSPLWATADGRPCLPSRPG